MPDQPTATDCPHRAALDQVATELAARVDNAAAAAARPPLLDDQGRPLTGTDTYGAVMARRTARRAALVEALDVVEQARTRARRAT